jgi:hypothetical protein
MASFHPPHPHPTPVSYISKFPRTGTKEVLEASATLSENFPLTIHTNRQSVCSVQYGCTVSGFDV